MLYKFRKPLQGSKHVLISAANGLWFAQSIFQSIDQWINEWMNKTINQSINQWVHYQCHGSQFKIMRENYNIHARPRPDSWLVCCPFRCHHEWRHEWQHGGLCPCRRSFGCVLLLDQICRKQCTVRQHTTLIYLINLLGKLVLGLGLELHYFSIFTENKKNEHLIFCECHGR